MHLLSATSCRLVLIGMLGCSLALAAEEQSENVLQAVQQLADRPELRLASTGDSADTGFEFTVDVSAPGIEPVRMLARRVKGRTSLVGYSGENQCYFYATDGLLLKVDSLARGRLLVVQETNFRLVSEGDAAGAGTRFNISIHSGGASEIIVDIPSTLRSLLPRAREVSRDRETGVLTIRAESATVEIGMHEEKDQDGFPIKSLTIKTAAGATLRFHSISVAPEQPAPMQPTIERLRQLPVTVVVEKWNDRIVAGQQMLPQRGTWDDPKVAAVGKAIADVVRETIGDRLEARPAIAEAGAGGDETLEQVVLDILRRQRQVLDRLDLTQTQREQIERLFEERHRELQETLLRLKRGDIGPDEALRHGMKLAAVAPDLRSILTSQQFVEFAETWLTAEAPAGTAKDPVREMLGNILSAVEEVEVSDLQREALVTLLTSLQEKWDTLTAAVVIRKIDQRQAWAEVEAIKNELINEMQRILTPSQYRELESVLGKRAKSAKTIERGAD